MSHFGSPACLSALDAFPHRCHEGYALCELVLILWMLADTGYRLNLLNCQHCADSQLQRCVASLHRRDCIQHHRANKGNI